MDARRVAAAGDQAPKRQTELESFSERFGASLRRLRELNDGLASRLEFVAPKPESINKPPSKPAPEVPEPTPGTIGSLHYIGNEQSSELDRLDSLLTRVQEIL